MTRITESDIESLAIQLLERQGYKYVHEPNIAPDSATPERESFEQVLLVGRLEKTVRHTKVVSVLMSIAKETTAGQ